jgi:hypothetical protein
MKKILAVMLILTFIATAGCTAEETDSSESAEQETITVEVPSGVALASEEVTAFFPEIEGYWFCRNIEETALNTYTESYVVAFYIDENGNYIGELSVYGLNYSEKGIIEFTAISKDNTYAEIIQYTEEEYIAGGSEKSENQSWFIIDTGEQGDDVIDISIIYNSSDGVDQIIEFENCVHYDSMDELDAQLY